MPELPEVETMVRGIRPHVEGRRIRGVVDCPCPHKPISVEPTLERFAARVEGQTITQVRRLAKRVVLHLSLDESIVIEPRMTGLMLLADPPDTEHLRIGWRFYGRAAYNSLWFWDRRGLGTVRLYSGNELAARLGPERLGPDALHMSQEQWEQRCAATSRPIKVALLDQKLSAGIGNLYASEILHRARIHPAYPADRLKSKQIVRLHRAVHEVLSEAIEEEGSTLSDATYRNALNQNGRYQSRHCVYGRADDRCPSCGRGRIRRIVQAQRSTFYCPACQRPARNGL